MSNCRQKCHFRAFLESVSARSSRILRTLGLARALRSVQGSVLLFQVLICSGSREMIPVTCNNIYLVPGTECTSYQYESVWWPWPSLYNKLTIAAAVPALKLSTLRALRAVIC